MCEVAGGDVLASFPLDSEFLTGIARDLCRRANAEFLTEVSSALRAGEYWTPPSRHEVARIRARPGMERSAAAHLQQTFLLDVMAAADDLDDGQRAVLREEIGRSEPSPFVTEPNDLFQMSAPASNPDDFVLDASRHSTARTLLGLDGVAGDGSGVKVGVLDSGVTTAGEPASTVARLNVIDWDDAALKHDVSDGYGHGTRMTHVIKDLAGGADFVVARVATDTGCTTAWHLMVGLSVISDCDVVNVSVASKLQGGAFPCRALGHEASSAILRTVIHDLEADAEAIVVAAAGNDSAPDLAFPARYPSVLAVVSVNSQKELSEFSNHGVTDDRGDPHPNVFAVYGGEHSPTGARSEEAVGTTATQDHSYYGTSYAAAYATALVARHLSTAADRDRDRVLDDLRTAAQNDPSWYVPQQHGNGLLVLP